MLTMYEQITIKTLHKQGKTNTEIADTMGCHRNTITNILNQPEVTEKIQRDKPSSFDTYHTQIKQYLKQNISRFRIWEILKDEYQIKQKYQALCKYVNKTCAPQKEAYIVQMTTPAEEAEVDFGFAGLYPRAAAVASSPSPFPIIPTKQKVWIFVMTLSYSRHAYYEAVTDQSIQTFIKCHINAFGYFSGVPKSVKIDNLKAAIITNTKYTFEITKEYLDFSLHYGFIVKACNPFSPNQKGKVEAGVKYVKRNFLAGRTFKDIADLQWQLKHWMINTANMRIHGTTRKVPFTAFTSEERDQLLPLPVDPFFFYAIFKRKVAVNCHIHFENNYYSVPSHLVGEIVEVRKKDTLIHIYHHDNKQNQDIEVAIHTVSFTQGEYITNPVHTPQKKIYSTTSYQAKYEEKMRLIGPHTHQFFKQIVARDKVWLKSIKYILNLARTYGNEKVEKATRRAIAFNAVRPGVIKRILEKNLENEEIEPALLTTPQHLHQSASIHTPSSSTSLSDQKSTSNQSPQSPITRDLSYYKDITKNR